MRIVSSCCLLVLVSALQALDAMSFSLRRAVLSLEPRLVRHRSIASSTPRWMSTQDAPVEKTEEEKAAIKAAREARK